MCNAVSKWIFHTIIRWMGLARVQALFTVVWDELCMVVIFIFFSTQNVSNAPPDISAATPGYIYNLQDANYLNAIAAYSCLQPVLLRLRKDERTGHCIGIWIKQKNNIQRDYIRGDLFICKSIHPEAQKITDNKREFHMDQYIYCVWSWLLQNNPKHFMNDIQINI